MAERHSTQGMPFPGTADYDEMIDMAQDTEAEALWAMGLLDRAPGAGFAWDAAS